MNFGEFLAEVLKRSAVVLGLAAAGAIVETGSDSLAQRFPRELRVTRLVGGALFVLGGLFWATADTVIFVAACVGSSWTLELQGAGDVTLVFFIWLVDLAMALVAVGFGLRWIRRGLAP